MGKHMPGVFEVMHGECAEIPVPDPTGLLRTITELESTPERTVYVGDSRVTFGLLATPARSPWRWRGGITQSETFMPKTPIRICLSRLPSSCCPLRGNAEDDLETR